MENWKVITQDKARKQNIVWASGVGLKRFLSFMQYAIDNCSRVEEFTLINPRNGNTYDAYMMATMLYGVRKRTFDERMNNVQTYSI